MQERLTGLLTDRRRSPPHQAGFVILGWPALPRLMTARQRCAKCGIRQTGCYEILLLADLGADGRWRAAHIYKI